MSKFSKSTIQQLGSEADQVIAQEILYGVDRYYNITITDSGSGLPYDLTGWQFQFRLIRRGIDDVFVNRHGELEVVGLKRLARELEIDLDSTIRVYDPTNGKIRLLLDNTFFSQVPSLIDADSVPCYTGYLNCTLPGIGTVGNTDYIPPQNKKILFMLIVRSDGVLA